MPFTLAINVADALVFNKIVLGKHKEVAVLESKEIIFWPAGCKYYTESR